MGPETILIFLLFWAAFGPILESKRPKTKSLILEMKMRSNQKVEENKPGLKFNFTRSNQKVEENKPGLKFNFTHFFLPHSFNSYLEFLKVSSTNDYSLF